MKERYVIDDFPVEVSFQEFIKHIRVEEEDDIAMMRPLFNEAVSVAKPKAVYRACKVQKIDGDAVCIEDQVFHSAVMAKNLRGVKRVLAYILTCGEEVDAWSRREKDYFVYLWLDALKELILRGARTRFFEMFPKKYGMEKFASMNPGSGNIGVWPIEQQAGLFALLGDVKGDAGVVLTDGFLMHPTKSLSGILFPSETGYVSCALCTREHCVNRQAPYDPSIMDA